MPIEQILASSTDDILEFTDRLATLVRTTEIPAERLTLVNAAHRMARELRRRERETAERLVTLERLSAEPCMFLRAQAG